VHMNRILVLAVVGLTGSLPALAAEYPIEINTDIKGKYYIVEKTGTSNNPVLVTKQVRPNATTHYIKRWFDCKNQTVRYLGEGDTLEELNKAAPEPDSTAIEEGSIPDQLAKHVCPK
jgi:hypothetical protein